MLKGDIDNLPVTHLESSHEIFKVTMKTLDQVYLESLGVLSSPMWRNSPAKKRADEKEMKKMANLMSPRDHGNKKDKDKDRRNSGNGDNKPSKKPKLGSTPGWTKCKCNNLSLLPLCFNRDYKICKSAARYDVECS